MHILSLLRAAGVSLLLMAVALISGCNDDDDESASIRLINAVSKSGSLYLYQRAEDEDDDDKLISFADLGEASKQHSVDNGLFSFYISDDGENVDDKTVLVDDFDITLVEEQHYVIALYGSFDTEGGIKQQNFSYEDFNSDKGRIALLALSANVNVVDLYMTVDDTPISEDAPVLTASYGEAPTFIDIADSDYAVEFTKNGENESIYNLGEVDIDDDETRFFVVLDNAEVEGELIDIINVEGSDETGIESNLDSSATSVWVRFVNAIPDNRQGSVDIYFAESADTDDDPVVDNLYFTEYSDFIELPLESGESPDYELIVTGSGSSTSIFSQSFTLTRGRSHSLYIAGLDEESSVDSYVVKEQYSEAGSNARVNFVHASPSSSSAVDLYILTRGEKLSAGPKDSDIAYLSGDSYTVDSGQYDIYVLDSDSDSDSDEQLFGPLRIDLIVGDNKTYTFVDAVDGGTPADLFELDNSNALMTVLESISQ